MGFICMFISLQLKETICFACLLSLEHNSRCSLCVLSRNKILTKIFSFFVFTTKEGKKLMLMLLQHRKTNKAEGKFRFISAQYFHIYFLKAPEAIIYFILLTFVFARAAFHSHVTLRN
jgi:hypothetical protein